MTTNTEYLGKLYDACVSGNSEAIDELSKIALGGNVEARKLVRKFDGLEKQTNNGLPNLRLNTIVEPGVPLSAWPKSDQERMKQGQKPKGCPIHSNV
jgi:hypothetical protein